MVILDPDYHPELSTWPNTPLLIASISIGEAEDRRSYWNRISSAPYLVEQDKETEGNVRVDIRSPEWQKILLEEEIPRAIRSGFQGIMLDQLDSITFLEDKDGDKFAGSREALQDWLASLRQAYPNLILLARGSMSLQLAAPYIDGYVVEGIFTARDRTTSHARKTTREERDEHLDQIGNALTIAPLPVFTIEEADADKKLLASWAKEESVKHGFHPFIKIK